ncbi:MAG: aminomethyltransferase family protein [bacterium]|nr:aminomethyl transferase family protein [Planctomycetota bacterium]HIL50716.1 aminomethyl transferase family protein [Planctomycetota bacterium]
MPRRTALFERTAALMTSVAWKEWAGYAAPCNFDAHSEREYFAIRHSAGLLDLSPLSKYTVTGSDAARYLARLWTRDITRLKPGRVAYACLCDGEGKLLDDGTVACLDPETFRVTSSEAWLGWFERHSRGFTVQIEDCTDQLAALALQGPLSRKILQEICGVDLDGMRFFAVAAGRIAGVRGWISRTGYTGDLGFEIWIAHEDALAVYDALLVAGKPYNLEPIGLDALDVARIEAGFVMQGVDYISAQHCLTEARKSTPEDAGLGWTVNLEREGWIGREALLRERAEGPKWALVGLELDWAEIEALHSEYGLPPHLGPVACRNAVPVYPGGGGSKTPVGQATSSTWSPTLKSYLMLAQVQRKFLALGTELQVEYTVEFERRTITARVVPRPFFDPERKTFTPSATPRKASQ